VSLANENKFAGGAEYGARSSFNSGGGRRAESDMVYKGSDAEAGGRSTASEEEEEEEEEVEEELKEKDKEGTPYASAAGLLSEATAGSDESSEAAESEEVL
jgi:hypothetical protein